MLATLIALALTTQGPTVTVQDQGTNEAVVIEDVEVSSSRLSSLIDSFVVDVAAPNSGRGLARWDRKVCVGAALFKPTTAQFLVDRVSSLAADLNLEIGEPGCRPNVLIIGTTDGADLAQKMVSRHRNRVFQLGGSGMDQGSSALAAFTTGERAVRWWQVSVPVDSVTGQRAVSLPGECYGSCSGPMAYAPTISLKNPSRLQTQIVDDLVMSLVIVDINQMGPVSPTQLADYIAMIAMAQFDPTADTKAFHTILNVVDDPNSASGLTDWDRSYLQGLYSARRDRASRNSYRSQVVSSVMRAHDANRQQSSERHTSPDPH